MAAPPFPVPSLNATFSAFDIFTDGAAARNTPPPQSPSLPGGPCNFVDLTHGPNGPRCGCRRFWSRQVAGASTYNVDQLSWCMCSHHACFHEDVQNTQSMPTSMPVVDNLPGQENEKPKSNREPLSPVVDLSFHQISNGLGVGPTDFTAFDFNAFPPDQGLAVDITPDYPPAPLGPPAPSAPPAADQDSMPDTLSWDNMPYTQEAPSPLPPIPSQFLLPDSPAASITTTSSIRHLRPFGGIGLNTLSGVHPRDQSQPREGRGTLRSEATLAPKQGEPPSYGAVARSPGSASPQRIVFQTEKPLPQASIPAASQDAETLQSLTNTLEDHEHRLEKLETGSFFDPTHEECFDKHDTTDLRMTEIESRMDDFERRLNDDASTASSHPVEHESHELVAASAIPAAENAALTKQVQDAVQARFNRMPTPSSPSFSSPWLLEVVFLPFPVRGIWHEAQDFKTPRLAVGREEWAQAPNAYTRGTPDPDTSVPFDEWAGDGADWLLPRACIPGRMIEQRLRSRGFIKTASVQGKDARSVQSAIKNAFGDIFASLPRLGNVESHYTLEPRLGKFFGLQQPWVPLRKVHKDSRLRFLAPEELLTPVSWDVTFLKGSVVMKATGVHRLYITQPQAYLQDSYLLGHLGPEHSVSWQKLREMACTGPESQSSNSGSEPSDAETRGDCWQYNARLDGSWPIRLPFENLRHSHEKIVAISRTSDGSTQQFFSAPSTIMSSSSPLYIRAESPVIHRQQLKSSHQSSIRAGSISNNTSSPVLPSPHSTRRSSSYAGFSGPVGHNYQRHSSPLVTGRPSPRLSLITNAPSSSTINKRRRRETRSPSMRFQHTPRRSYRGLTRSPSVIPFLQNVYIEEQVRGEPRLTPTAYATPFSNAPLEDPDPQNRRSSIELLEEDEAMFLNEGHESTTDEDDDEDPDVDVYQDEKDMLDDLESVSDHPRATPRHRQLPKARSSSPPQGPEDHPWPGIEDHFMSGGENVNPRDSEENDEGSDGESTHSETSSSPSEYSSTRPPHLMSVPDDRREMTHGLEGEDTLTGWNGFPNYEEDDEEDEDEDEDDEEQHKTQNLW